MNNGIADSAVGAILEIPPQTLQDIDKAERAIKQLALTSAEAAGKVNDHWGVVAPNGLQKFIDKIAEAQKAMDGLGTINVTLNTQAAVQSTEQLSTATQRTSADVSKAVQDMAASWNDLAKVSLKGFDPTNYGNNITEIKLKLEKLQQERDNLFVKGSTNQALVDEIRQIEEYIRLYKLATEEKNKALGNIQQKQQSQTDKAYLDEQKRLLDRILQLRKDIANISISVQRGTITGKEDMSKDLAQLEQLRKELRETGVAYKDLRLLASLRLSDEGKVQSEIISQNAKNAGLRQEIDERNKLNQAITRANELTAQGQQGKTRLGSGEEAAIQRQLNSDYKAMIGIIREQGELKAKVASEGRQMTQQEIDLIAALGQRYKIYYDDIQRVAGAYSKMSEAAAKNFQADKSEQLARNAILLADAQNKAAEAAQKVADAQAKAAQQQADRDRSQAESDLNRLYTERLRLLKEKEQLENKATVNTAKGLPDLTAKESQLLSELTAKLQSVDSQIKTIGNSYAELAAKAQHAFELPKLRQAVQLQNQLNDALNAVDTSKTKELVTEYKEIYNQYQKLKKSLDEYNSKIAGTAPVSGLPSVTPNAQAIANEMANLSARMAEIERKNIQEVADFRMQKDMEANQRSISEFVQAEAQKTAEAKRQADERARYQQEQSAKYFASYKGSLNYANAVMGSSVNRGIATNTFENRERAIKNLEAAIKNLNKADADYERKLKELTDALNKLKSAQKEVTDAMKPSKPMVSPQDAINAAKNATTLKQLQDAYKQLKEVMAATDPKSQAWSQMNSQLQKTKTSIDEIKKKMGEFQSQASKTSGLMGQLQGRIAAAFSIGAISGFIKKMVEVRAQFELQRVALGAIIQDRDEANKIFTQVQNMALESPFNIMQLEKATKQIAAFGFETQKLVPTMKMFADISAGLGVEIDRLVLVMGHLKARNFLEGTMVRQFTNMGFNVLGELSKYYSELENKMVSVGEVQDRVKKKMVSFEDVEEVLKRVTSAGGMFYDMQKKQSDSLWGQMQRITDAYDLMLNEIGKDNQNVISKALTAIRALINSWRTLAPIIKDIGYIMAGVFAVKGVKMLLTGFTALGGILLKIPVYLKSIVTGIKAMNLAWSTTGIGALVAIGLTAWEVFRGLNAEANALKEELDRIGDESVKSVNESIVNFKSLADTLSDANKTYAERNNALQELKRIYHDILPQEKLEWDYIVGLNGNYKELTKTIVDYYSAKEYQHKYEAVMSSKQAKDVTDELQRAYKRMNEDGALGMIFPENQIKEWANKVATELNSGKIENSIEALAKRTKEIFGENIDVSKYIVESYGKADFTDVIDKVEKVKTEVNDLSLSVPLAENAVIGLSESFANMDAEAATQKIGQIKDRIKFLTDEIERLNNTSVTAEPFKYDKLEKYQAELNSLNANLNALDEARAKIIAQDIQKKIEDEIKVLTDLVSTWWKNKMAMESLALQGEQGTKAYKDLEAAQKRIVASAPDLEEKLGVKIPWSILQSTQTTYDLQQQLDVLSEQAFPNAAKAAMDKMSDVERSILSAKNAMDSFLKGVADLIPESWAAGFNQFAQALGFTTKKAEDATESIAGVYSELAKKRSSQFGADISEINKIIDKNLTRGEAAKKLREKADEINKTLKSYDTSTAQSDWLKLEDKTEQGIAQMRKDVKAIEALAADLDGVNDKSKGGKGKDPWQDRLSLFKEINTEYEKLLKNYSAEESKQRIQLSYAKAVAEIFKGQGKFGDISNWIGFDKESMIEMGQQMLDTLKISPEKRKDMEKQLAGLKAEVDVHFQEDAVKAFEKHMQEIADNFELSEIFRNLGVPIELTYSLGGKPTTLADQRKELEDNYYEIFKVQKKYGEEGEKAYDKIQQDIAKKEQKNLQERAKNYVKYLTESMGERAQIEIKALQDINKIENDATLDAFSKQQAMMQRRKKMQEELTKFDLDELKSSDVYISVFKDLETASKEQLQYVIDKLKETQTAFSDLSPAQVKSIANDLKKLESALASKDSVRNLFSNLKTSIEYAKKRNDLLKEQTQTQEEVNDSTKELSDAQVRLTNLQLKLKSIQDESSDEWKDANAAVEAQQQLVKELQDKIAELEEKLKKLTGEIEDGESAWEGWRKGINNIRNGMNQVKDSLDAVFDGLDSMGLVNDTFRDTYESIGDIVGGLGTFMDGLASIDMKNPFTIITGSIKAIGGIAQTIGAAFGIGDKKKEREIQRLTEKVETLDKAYQKLEKSIEAAYTFSDYNAGFKKMQQSLDAQKQAYEEMIRLEEAKKKSDDDKVKEYKDKLEEIAEAEKELYEKRHEMYGSTNDVWDEANNWVDAWLDAYKETGDGLNALNDSWDEFYENLVKKQAASKVLGARMDSWIKQINDAIDKNMGSEYDYIDLFKQIGEKMKADFDVTNADLKKIFEYAGIGGGAGSLILSDLQKGIQNITEPQAAAIEAYLNSMRFAVFHHTEQLDTLIATIQRQYGSGAENPVVTELKGIRSVLDSINSKFDSVIGKNGFQSAIRIVS